MPRSRTFPHMSGRHLAGAGPLGGLPARTPACGLSRCWASSQHGSLVPHSLNRAEWKHMHFYYLVLWLQNRERTQDCSPGHAGKEDPHLAMTGASCWFLELRCQCAVSDEVRREAQGAFHVASGNSGLHAHGKGVKDR